MSEVSATKICRISNSKPLCRVKFLALYHKSVCLYFELNILSMCIFFMNPYLNLVSLFSNQLSFQTHQIQTKAPLFLKSSSRLIVYFNLTVEAEPLIVAVAVWFGECLSPYHLFWNRHCSCQGDSNSVFLTPELTTPMELVKIPSQFWFGDMENCSRENLTSRESSGWNFWTHALFL